MARSLNRCEFIGHLRQDPELKYTSAGTAVVNFSLATSESWKDADGNQQEKTEWHNIVVWKKLAEVCGEWLKKGSKVYVAGKLTHRNYDDKNGVKHYVSEIVINEMLMLDNKAAGTQGKNEDKNEPAEPERRGISTADTDGLPF
jgi:single-strand DNA-binding protein